MIPWNGPFLMILTNFSESYLNLPLLRARRIYQLFCSYRFFFSQYAANLKAILFFQAFVMSLEVVLVFYYFATNYHKLSDLKQHIFIMSQFPQVRSLGIAYLGPLSKVSQDCNQSLRQAMLSFGGSRGKICFKAYSGVARIYFLGCLTEGSAFCQLLAGGCSQVQEAD